MQSSIGKRRAQGRVPARFAIGTAIAAAGLAASAGGYAADAQTDTESGPALQEVVVTGSLIRRTDTETPSPVQVISAQDLAETGYTNVSDVLRNLSANGQGTLTQSFTQAFAGGGAGVALRGLTVGATLTLIDGKRMVPYPLSDDGERSFVDVTEIPLNAVDHIEVLKDGASAVYGSDAIAGVVNVILKKSYQGFEAGAEYGVSSHNDGTTEHFTAIGGTGDLVNDGYNAYVTFEFRNQDDILVSDRHEQFTNLNLTGLGGLNTTPGLFNNPTIAFPGSTSGYLINPNTATGTPFAFLPGCTQAAATAGNCTYQLKGLQLQPSTQNINVVGRLTKALPGDWEASVTASWFNSKAEQIGPLYPGAAGGNGTGYPGGLFNVAIGPGQNPTVVPSVPLVITVPATYPGNPFGVAAPLAYNFHELGLISDYFDTDTYRLFAEAKGGVLGWDIDADVGVMYATTGQTIYGGIEPVALQAALNAPDPYIVGADATGAGSSAFSPVARTTDSDTLDVVDLHGTHKLFDLPGGPMQLGIGYQYMRRVLNDLAPPAVQSGLESGNNAYAVGGQDDSAAFAEVDMPLFKGLEADAAVRYDHYNIYAGGATTPKFGVKYQPFEQLVIRGTYAEGFRAPNPAEAGQAGEGFFAATIPDPVLCPKPANANSPGNFPSQCSVELLGVQQSNPNLKPVHSTNYTFGVIVEPIKDISVSVDYYDVKLRNDIISAFELGGLAAFLPSSGLIRGPNVKLPFVNPDGSISTVTTPVGEILYQPFPYLNATSDNTNGIDVDFKAKVNTGDFGYIHAEVNYTHILEYNISFQGIEFELAGTHGPSGISGDTGNPRDRAVLSVGWSGGPLDVTASVNYISSFSVTDPSAGQDTCEAALTGNFSTEYGSRFLAGSAFPASVCTVGSFTDLDLYASYRLGRHFQVHGSILNVTGALPPLDVVTYGGGGAASYDAALHQAGAVGRFFTVGANYQF